MKVALKQARYHPTNAVRGIGMYSRLLEEYLSRESGITVVPADSKESKTDLVHYTSFDLFYPTLPFRPWQKTVVTIHDVIPLLYPKQYPVGIKGKAYFFRQKTFLKTVSRVITDSLSSQRDIEKFLEVPSSKIRVVSLAGQPELTQVANKEIAKVRRNYAVPKQYCLYVGDINYNKNIPQLIKMLKYLPEQIGLVCVGKSMKPSVIPEWRAIESQIALSNVENRVVFLPTIASDDFSTLSALYSGALCYVQPSLYEGFGIPVLEAMQCGAPVVSSRTSSLTEIVGEAGMLVEPEAEAFAEGLLQIMAFSATKRQKVIDKALKHAKTFSWDKTAKATLAVYSELITKS